MGTANLALMLWIPLSVVISGYLRSPQAIFLVVFLGGSLLLPERMHLTLPGAPPLDKHVISAVAAWVALSISGRGILSAPPRAKGGRVLLLWFFVSAVCTWLNNVDTLTYGTLVLPGHSFREAVWSTSVSLLRIVLPYSLAQRVFKTPAEIRTLLKGFVVAGLLYTPLIFLEARIAPILHQKVYGYFQHDWSQSLRGDGFRAFVFMSHGLAVAFFVSQALIAVSGLRKAGGITFPFNLKWASWILTAVLISCKSLGAMLFAGVSVPMILYTSARAQSRLASLLAGAVIMYPLARLYGWIPTDWLIEQALKASADRAGSLEFRFINEDVLLTKALERKWFGWGWWARNRVYDVNGSDTTVTDGEWVIHLGQGGAFKFLIVFGLLLLPIWKTGRSLRKCQSDADARALTTCALLLAVAGVDLIPNASSNGFAYVVAGALSGTCTWLLRPPKQKLV